MPRKILSKIYLFLNLFDLKAGLRGNSKLHYKKIYEEKQSKQLINNLDKGNR